MTPIAPLASANADNGFANIASHDAFAHGVPHATFDRLRREEPVAWFDEVDGSGFWAITRYKDIFEFNLNFRNFTTTKGIRLEEMSEDEMEKRRSMMELDPPDHTKQRQLVNRAFTRKIMDSYEPQIRAIADTIMDEALSNTEFEALDAIAKPLPMRMLGRIMGTPESDDKWLISQANQMIANSDPEFTDHVIDQANTEKYRFAPFRSPAGLEIFKYAEKQAALRNREPRDDVTSMLLRPKKDGKPLSETEFKNFFTLLVAAGNDTTRYTIASSLHALANQPELFRQLQTADEALWDTAADEFIRWASVTMHFRRTAREDTEQHGKTIKAGDKVVLWFISGNRDTSVFNKPHSIDLKRKENPHLAFGGSGPHNCLGLWLARLELRVVLQEFVKRVKRVQQTGPEVYLRSNFINGIKRLPLSIERL